MDVDGRFRSSGHRSGSRRGARENFRGSEKKSGHPATSPSDPTKNHNGYNSSEEEGETGGRGFLSPVKSGERLANAGRSRVSPLDMIISSQEGRDGVQYFNDKDPGNPISESHSKAFSNLTSHKRGNQPPSYYTQDFNTVGNEYESPKIRGKNRSTMSGVRRLGPHSSMSSSDNNSDTTYAESDLNNSLRTRMVSLDNNAGTPPEPAPPEVPPRGPSHHHPLLTSQRRGVACSQSSEAPGTLVYQDNLSNMNDDGYQQPSGNIFMSQEFNRSRLGGLDARSNHVPERFIGPATDECEYLMSGTNARYVGSMRKSPMGHPGFGASPTRDVTQHDFNTTAAHLITTFGSQKDVGALNSSGGLSSANQIHRNNLTMTARTGITFSGRKLRLEKSWKERLSWRCACIFLLLFCAVLIAILTFFAASYASLETKAGCILVEDAARVVAAAEPQKETSTLYPSPAFTIPIQKTSSIDPKLHLNDRGEPPPILKSFNERYFNKIEPQSYWGIQFIVKTPTYIRFNLSVPSSAQLAFFGRRNVAPSITQYDFVKFVSSGNRGRVRRHSRGHRKHSDDFEADFIEPLVPLQLYNIDPSDFLISNFQNKNHLSYEKSAYKLNYYPETFSNSVMTASSGFRGNRTDDDLVSRQKRFLDRIVNLTIVEFLDSGKWYLSIYNDGLGTNQVSLLVEEASELQSACLSDCSGHGSCVHGECDCAQGWIGEDCSKSVCPVLCSGHGTYSGGMCHCTGGWKGLQCDVPTSECEISDCNKHGVCRGGTCFCDPGWKGDKCDEIDCPDPTCGTHGTCVSGRCLCHAGWTGTNCSRIDEKVFACLPDCSGNGRYNLQTSTCICNEFWAGVECSIPRCALDCVHGVCDGGVCKCNEGWMGTRCTELACDSRCSMHGQCHNGTCVCVQGWNGKHCTIPGCVNSCSGNGICTTGEGQYRCACSPGWTSQDCSVSLETQCSDDVDNDGDGLVDCSDSECCSTAECREHVMCMVSADPVEVLLRKQPPATTASFYQKVKFIIEDRNVQSFAKKEEFTERRASVIRGRVVTPDGEGIVGVRTSVEKESKYGLTATRKDGWFDVLVNGGGAVTLQFQRAHFEPLTITVPVLWNKITVLEPIVMHLKDQALVEPFRDLETEWSDSCMDHDYELMRPEVIPSYLPSTVGGASEDSVVYTEARVVQESLRIPGSNVRLIYLSSSVSGYLSSLLLQLTPGNVPKTLSMVHLKVAIEGRIFERIFEADPNINFTFTWDKRNVYKQKVYGGALAEVSVGYEYTPCSRVVWETLTAPLYGFLMDISDIGGWNLDIHHMYNFESGLLQRGDGSTLNLKASPRLVSTLVGTGTQRTVSCKMCSGLATDAQLLSPTVLTNGPDGSIYVGDFNLIRRVTPDGLVSTVLKLSSSQASHGYYMTMSPADGRLYVSDASNYRILRTLTVGNVTDAQNNFETVVGNGERCIPGDEHHCGDKGPAKRARLAHPKGLAISADGTLFIADGTNVRVVDTRGIIHTLIGHHGHRGRWKPFPCKGGVSADQVELQWPTELALSPLDNTLHILDDHVILQATHDGVVRVKAGNALHCKSSQKNHESTISSLAFAPCGSLFVSETTADKNHFIKKIDTRGTSMRFAGASYEDCGCSSASDCNCPQDKFLLSTNVLFGRLSALTVSGDGVVHAADQKSLKVFSLKHFLPQDDENGEYHVAYPSTNELYVFNRHGHHIETRDLTTGRTLYSFLYSKNTSFGRLSKVTDSSGNKIMFLRDYKSAVSQIENTAGEKFKVDISRLGLMTSFVERMERRFYYTYDDDSGLLLSSTAPGSLTSIYEYDYSGQLKTIITPTGSRIKYQSWIGKRRGKSHLTVGVGEVKPYENDFKIQYSVAILGSKNIELDYGPITGSMKTYSNGSSVQTFPWGGKWSTAVTTTTNPLLESILPIQARLFPLTTAHIVSSAAGESPNRLVMSYGVVADKSLRERLVEKVILVNGTRVLSQRWKGSDWTNKITDGERGELMRTTYNVKGQTNRIVLGKGVTTLKISYDRFGRIQNREWERTNEQYEYSNRGLLTGVKTQSGVTKYSFRNNERLLESITLPSGRTWVYNYDTEGGLKSVTTPAGSAHTFSCQLSFGFYVFSYTPPGSNHPYRQHIDHESKLKMTIYPGGYPKIVYDYTEAGKLKSVVSGGGMTEFFYNEEGLLEEILHQENVDYKMDFMYHGNLMTEFQLNYGLRTGLSNSKFIYEYDSNFRLAFIGGRIGGQNLKPFEYKYSPISGRLNQIGNFKIARPGFNETITHDGTAIFSRVTNSQFKVIRTSLTIHKMEVFRRDTTYRPDGKVSKTDTYTRNFHTNPYLNTNNYTYDSDGQLIAVSAKKPWSFSYDSFGNMLSLTYSTNTIPMKYDAQDRIIKFGDGVYKYNNIGAIVQDVRGVNFRYNARGLLIQAKHQGRFTIDYSYDHEKRLVARKDNFGNVTQFSYANPAYPDKPSHIYNPRDGHLITLTYDDRGHVIYAQVYRNKYYIATDDCGTPLMMFNQYGEVIREMMRSPYGHIMYDSNPYVYLPIGFCGGILDSKIELVHMSEGKVYNPLVGMWLSPDWKLVQENLMKPGRLSLYRYKGNDPINTGKEGFNWKIGSDRDWLKLLGYNLEGLAPQLYMGIEPTDAAKEGVLNAFSGEENRVFSPFSNNVKKTTSVSGFILNAGKSLSTAAKLSSLTQSKLRTNFDPENHQFEILTLPGPFGKGIISSVEKGKTIVSATPQANPIFKDVLDSVFSGAYLLDIFLNSRNSYVFYFVKKDLWKASEDMNQLNRLAGEVNITFHEPGQGSNQGDYENGEKVIDVKLHSPLSILHIRYGAQPKQEKKRLIKRTKKQTIRKAWAIEREKMASGLAGTLDWSSSEIDQLLSRNLVPTYNARFLHSADEYPELCDDPTNVIFVKDAKRTRRNLKNRFTSKNHFKSRRNSSKTHHRCRRRRKFRRNC